MVGQNRKTEYGRPDMAARKRRSDEERLEELERRGKAIEARRKALRARVAKKERARDTRRKILVGSLLLHRMESDPENGPRFRAWLRRELPGFLRDADRDLFRDVLDGDPPEPDGAEPRGDPPP